MDLPRGVQLLQAAAEQDYCTIMRTNWLLATAPNVKNDTSVCGSARDVCRRGIVDPNVRGHTGNGVTKKIALMSRLPMPYTRSLVRG